MFLQKSEQRKQKVPKNNLPKHVVDVWPEVLKDVDIQVVPLEYLHSVRVTFVDGKVWEIDVEKSKAKDLNIENSLEELFEEYEDSIANVDFRLDTERVKADITKRTHQFMKKRR